MQVRSKFDDPTGKVTETGQSVFPPPINIPTDIRPNTPDWALVKQVTHNKRLLIGGLLTQSGGGSGRGGFGGSVLQGASATA